MPFSYHHWVGFLAPTLEPPSYGTTGSTMCDGNDAEL